MSTRLTKRGVPMVDSQSLKLVFGTATINEQISYYLSNALVEQGYDAVTPSVLHFLSALECGVNYASEIARDLNVSRQMVAKTVKQLCQVGYLEQLDGVGKQKQIHFTELGEHLMSDSRQLLASLDKVLIKKMGKKSLEESLSDLEKIKSIMEQLNKT